MTFLTLAQPTNLDSQPALGASARLRVDSFISGKSCGMTINRRPVFLTLVATTVVVAVAALVVYDYQLPGILVGGVGIGISVTLASRIYRRIDLVLVAVGLAVALVLLSYVLFLFDLAAHGGG